MSPSRLVIVATALFVVSCCASRSARPQTASAARPRVLAIWNKNFECATRFAIAAERSELMLIRGEFEDVVYFFESLTHIRCRCDGTLIGQMPCAELTGDVESWRSWFLEHGPEVTVTEAKALSRLKRCAPFGEDARREAKSLGIPE